MQTLLHLSDFFINAGPLGLLFGRGTHEPSPAESQAPFYQDPAQRVVVLDQISVLSYLVLRVGALLELIESREGSEVEWEPGSVTEKFLADGRLGGRSLYVGIAVRV